MNSFKAQAAQKPTAQGSLLQSSCYGQTIPVIFGTTQSVPLAIWAANLRQGGSTKKFKQFKKGITSYVENIDFLIAHSPVRGVLRVWNNGGLYPLAFTSQSFSAAGGPGSYEVTDEHFYFVIAVTLECSYSFEVNDYGGKGPATLSGTWEIPLWNELETGPDPTAPSSYRNWPYCYRWQSGFGPTVTIDAQAFPGGALKVYYAQLMDATSFQPPISHNPNNMFFEGQLGEGSEYSDAGSPFDTQQIVYPQFAGVASSDLDLGASGTIPQLLFEIAGKWGIYPTGDADFADMIEDVFKSGVAQAAIAASDSTPPEPPATQLERGLSSYNFPGTIQRKVDAGASSPVNPLIYDMPNVTGNVLVAIAQGTGGFTVASSAGETWAPILGGGPNQQVWVANALGGPNTVTISGTEVTAWSAGILEIGGMGPATYIPPIVPSGGTIWAYPSAAPDDGLVDLGGYVTAGETIGPVTFDGFAVPGGLPAGAVISSILPVAIAGIVISASSAAYAASGVNIVFPSTPTGFGGTFTGTSLGTSPADIAGGGFTFEVSASPFSEGWGTIDVYFLGLLISYTIPGSHPAPPPSFPGSVVDYSAASLDASANLISTVTQGQPGYLLAIPFYGVGAVEIESEGTPVALLSGLSFSSGGELVASPYSAASGAYPGGWDSASPLNIFGNQPPTFNLFERIVRTPGEYPFTVLGPEPSTLIMVSFKAVQPVPYPKPLGDFIDLASLDLVRKQCRASGLYGSLSMMSQSPASDWLKSFYQAADAAPVFLGDKLFSYPYSEVSAAGNGSFYEAPTAAGPIAELTDLNGDFIDPDTPELDTVSRIDLPNVLQLQIVSRENQYYQVTVAQPESASMALYGVRKADPITNSAIQDTGVARQILGIMVRKNQYGGDVYSFTLSPRWMLLSPMDLVTVTDTLANLIGVPVRLTSCEEQDDCSTACEAEPFIYGMYAPTVYATDSPAPNPVDTTVSAGDVNPPIIFEPVPALCAEQPQAQLWLVISSPAENYGGCQVYVSTNGGASYVPAADPIVGNATTGVLTADWPAAVSPDGNHNLSLDLSDSNGTLESYAESDEDNFLYPCYVGGSDIEIQNQTVAVAACLAFTNRGTPVSGPTTLIRSEDVDVAALSLAWNYELMTYALAGLTGPSQYTLVGTLGWHLNRSVFGAPNPGGVGVAHGTGERFAFLSPAGTGICKLNMASTWIGVELFFKVMSFNEFGAALQNLSDVTAYSYTPTGVPYA